MSTESGQPLTLDIEWGAETIQVSNIARTLPAEPTDEQQQTVIEAARQNPGIRMPEGALTAIATAVTQPGALAVQLRPTGQDLQGVLMVENVEGATLYSAVTRVLMSELFPGIQPRTGMEVLEVPDPQVQGITQDGLPSAGVEYHYADLDHLSNHVWQTIYGTLAKNSYATSIVTRSVTRNLITHPVRITFEDGTEPIHALVVRDGITRLASAWSVLAGPRSDAAAAADLARQALLGGATAASERGKGPGLEQRLAASRRKGREELRAEFAEEIHKQVPAARAAQIFQSFTVPAQIAVGIDAHTKRLLSADDLFDDAIRSVLASIHVEFKQWETAAQNVEVITRALKRIVQSGDPRWSTAELQEVYGLAVGRIPVTDLPRVVGGEDTPPATALWRAVYLLSALTKPELFQALKEQAKVLKGDQRMQVKGFAGLLGPVIDLPWRTRKRLVTPTARNAWSNGGVLTPAVVGGWSPKVTDDFTTLVEPAMSGDIDARCTLAVAGGVALIADKLLTRNVGSSLNAPKEKGGVPFRLDTHKVIEGLSRQGNELGLRLLAMAANTFRGDDLPLNAVAKQSLTGKNPAETDKPYVYFKVDLAAEDGIARTADGVPVMLYEWDVVAASDPDRARSLAEAEEASRTAAAAAPSTEDGTATPGEAATDSGEAGGTVTDPAVPLTGEVPGELPHVVPGPRDSSPSLPPSQRAAELTRHLRHHVQATRDVLDRILPLEAEVGVHTPPVPSGTLDELVELLVGIQADVENLRRRTASGGIGKDDEDDPYGELNADADALG
ncbi:hypothetical protein [Streptomyces sp.]|uniref:hypothetical protein n=1 Tax=Streptomyces sp. TaxID=1931 RepID=UPI002810EC03|nr:hypothetical protein [Streptomyces sp.]